MKLGATIPNIELGNDLASITAFVQAAEDLDYDYLNKILPRNIIPAYDGISLNL